MVLPRAACDLIMAVAHVFMLKLLWTETAAGGRENPWTCLLVPIRRALKICPGIFRRDMAVMSCRAKASCARIHSRDQPLRFKDSDSERQISATATPYRCKISSESVSRFSFQGMTNRQVMLLVYVLCRMSLKQLSSTVCGHGGHRHGQLKTVSPHQWRRRCLIGRKIRRD
jgi:hypothetical protein